jgi:hypothetical protein
MLSSIGRVALGIALIAAFGCPADVSAQDGQDWQTMPNNQMNQITNTTQWHSMTQTLQRAGYVRAVNKEEGYVQFITGYPGYAEKLVLSGWRNPTTQKVAVPGFLETRAPDGSIATIYCYTVGEVINGVQETTTYGWDTPANIGDDSRIIQILSNYAGCVMGGLAGTAAASFAAGAYDGDNFMPTLIGGTSATYGQCIFGALRALAGW